MANPPEWPELVSGAVEEAGMRTASLDKALSLVELRGSFMDRVRAQAVIEGQRPGSQAVDLLLSNQDPCGGFYHGWLHNLVKSQENPGPSEQPQVPGISPTLDALWWMDDLDMLRLAPAQLALGYLADNQCPDGGWDEAPVGPHLTVPPWAEAGNPAARTYLTAYASYWLLRVDRQHSTHVKKALDYLCLTRQETGWYQGFAHSTWIIIAALALARGLEAREVERGLVTLSSRPLSLWADSQLAWALDCLTSAGLTAARTFVGKAATELVNRQAPDGSWSSEDGPDFMVTATISSAKALKRLGLAS